LELIVFVALVMMVV
jgi:hypothetical protein